MPDGGRIIIFATNDNIFHLSHSPLVLMDGTFRTVSLLFQQLYTLHGVVGEYTYSTYSVPVRTAKNISTQLPISGPADNTRRIVPLVFALMTSKSQEYYISLLRSIR